MNKLKILYVLAIASSILASCRSEIDQPIMPESTLAPDEEYLNIELVQEKDEDLRNSFSYVVVRDMFGLTIHPDFAYANTSMDTGYYNIHADEPFKMPEAIIRPSYKDVLIGEQALARVSITYLDSVVYEGDQTINFNQNKEAYGHLKIKLKKKRLEYIQGKLGQRNPQDDLHDMFNDMEEVVPVRKQLHELKQREKELNDQYQALLEEALKDPNIADQIKYWLENGSPDYEDNSPAAEVYRRLSGIARQAHDVRAAISPLEYELNHLYGLLVKDVETGLKISIFLYGDVGELDPSGKYRYKAPYQQWGYLSGGRNIGKAPKIPYFGYSTLRLGNQYSYLPVRSGNNVQASIQLNPYGAISRTYIANLSNEAVDVRSVSMPQLNLDGELLIDRRKGTLEFPSPTTNTGGVIPLNVTVPAFSHAVVYHWFPAISGAHVPHRQSFPFDREFTLGNGKIIKPEPQNYDAIDGQPIRRSTDLDGHSLTLAHLARRNQRQGVELEAGMLYIIGKNPYLKSQEGVNRIIFPFGNSTAYPPADGEVSYFVH